MPNQIRDDYGHVIGEDLTDQLPYDAACAGMSFEFDCLCYRLRDGANNLLQEWRGVPSLTELREVSLKMLEDINHGR